MKYKEVKRHYDSGGISRHYFVDENGNIHGEVRMYHENGRCSMQAIGRDDRIYGETKSFTTKGTLCDHRLKDGEGNDLATVIGFVYSRHTEEQLIEIAKEHNLPLLSEIPKTEAEVTLWNLKYPDLPLLPPVSTPTKITPRGILRGMKQCFTNQFV